MRINCFLLQNLLFSIPFARSSGTGTGRSSKPNSFDIPITARNKRQVRRDISGFIGLGDANDVYVNFASIFVSCVDQREKKPFGSDVGRHYSVVIELGNSNKVFPVELGE